MSRSTAKITPCLHQEIPLLKSSLSMGQSQIATDSGYHRNTKAEKSLCVLKQPDHSLAKDQRIIQLGTARSGSATADTVQSSPKRDMRLNTVGFSSSGALGFYSFTEIKS